MRVNFSVCMGYLDGAISLVVTNVCGTKKIPVDQNNVVKYQIGDSVTT